MTLQPPLRISAADKADDTRHSDPQCWDCGCALGRFSIAVEKDHQDGLCRDCRSSRTYKAAEQRVADFRENCPKCMASILDAVETLLDGWEVEDLVGDHPWCLWYHKTILTICFDKDEHRITVVNSLEEWRITFTETTPPSLVKSALEAAIKASV